MHNLVVVTKDQASQNLQTNKGVDFSPPLGFIFLHTEQAHYGRKPTLPRLKKTTEYSVLMTIVPKKCKHNS